jgi:hypothetical protein
MSITPIAPSGYTLASNISATGAWVLWPGGRGSFTAVATFGGGTVKLQTMGPDASTAIDVGTDTTLTAAGGGNFELGRCYIRCSITTATAVYAVASPLG